MDFQEVDEFEMFRARACGVEKEIQQSSAGRGVRNPQKSSRSASQRQGGRVSGGGERNESKHPVSYIVEETIEEKELGNTLNGGGDDDAGNTPNYHSDELGEEFQLERSQSWKSKRPSTHSVSWNASGENVRSSNMQRTRTMPARRKHTRQPATSNSTRRPYEQSSGAPDVFSDGEVGTPESGCVDSPKVYRMRSFYTKAGNVVNQGDSVKVRGNELQSSHEEVAEPHSSNRDESRSSRSVTRGGQGQSGGRLGPTGAAGGGAGSSNSSCQPWGVRNLPAKSDVGNASNDGSSRGLTGDRGGEGGHSRQGWDRTNSGKQSVTLTTTETGGQVRTSVTAKNREEAPTVYKVLVLGSQGVGKTTLTQQLLTSEYLANQDSYMTQGRPIVG